MNGTNLLPNGGMLAGVSTPLFYWSIVEEPVTDFYLQTECPGLYSAFRLISTGPSLFTNTLLSMQYQIEKGRSQPTYSKTDEDVYKRQIHGGLRSLYPYVLEILIWLSIGEQGIQALQKWINQGKGGS